jgi:SAM-dependent methyltransferase
MMIIDLGAGPWPKADATVKVDAHKWREDYIVHDFLVFPYPFESNVAQKIYFGDVIEHIPKFVVDNVLSEIHRILSPNGVVEITTPDIEWIAERIYKKDWKLMANVDWLNKHDDPFENAMDIIYGGWLHPVEYKIPGMGHINGFNEEKLMKYLSKTGFKNIVRVPDMRNPEPARNSVLKMLAYK